MSTDLSDEFERAIENESNASDVDRVERRACTSNRFTGAQYNIYGEFVTIRPIIETVAGIQGIAIEHLYMSNDTEEPFVGVFVADLPEQEHPAFV